MTAKSLPSTGLADSGPSAPDWQGRRIAELQSALAGGAGKSRDAIVEALGDVIREAVATGIPAALVLVDLSNFTEINAAWGQSQGNEILATAGVRIEDFAAGELADAAPIVARLDADHFVLMISRAEPSERLREKVKALIRRLAEPLSLSSHAISLDARAAVLLIPADGRSATSVLGRAFQLLNNAARSAPDSVAFFDSRTAEAATGPWLERDLAEALTSNQIFIALQPKIELATGLIYGAEALARWRHPQRGLIAPPVFVAAAERSGLIFELGLRILRDACRFSTTLAADGQALSIAVNVSPHQLAHPDFLARFLEVIDREGVEPSMLEIEITETAAMMGGERIRDSLNALKRCGIRIGLDDFGTGFSNLASLSRLPADTLKIDRSLVVYPEGDQRAAALLAITAELARTFGMKTVAEGVETEMQLERVRRVKCDYVQGYLTGVPVEADRFAETYLRE